MDLVSDFQFLYLTKKNIMKLRCLSITLFIFCVSFSNSTAQLGHTLQVDDGAGHYSTLKGPSTGGTFFLPSGGGTLVTSTSLPYADFYALMPADNAATVAPGTAVSFPQNGPTSGVIARTNPSQFNLPNIGTYEISFQVSVVEAGQLMLQLNGVDVAYSVAGRATGTSQISNTCLVTTSSANSILQVINPAGNPTALTITPLAGGTRAVSAHLVIRQLQ